mmetsp:Transcript_9426/g.14909  ORF Transcript_9426/g.14909 Transcript_9426/m.14909 type:complete len:325 (-) Transcript_9426:150-1124(-)
MGDFGAASVQASMDPGGAPSQTIGIRKIFPEEEAERIMNLNFVADQKPAQDVAAMVRKKSRSKLSPEMIKEYFHMVTLGGNCIRSAEFTEILQNVGVEVESHEIAELFLSADENDDGMISLEEWNTVLSTLDQFDHQRNDVDAAFRSFIGRRPFVDGHVHIKDLHEWMLLYDYTLSEREVNELCSELKVNANGMFHFAKFLEETFPEPTRRRCSDLSLHSSMARSTTTMGPHAASVFGTPFVRRDILPNPTVSTRGPLLSPLESGRSSRSMSMRKMSTGSGLLAPSESRPRSRKSSFAVRERKSSTVGREMKGSMAGKDWRGSK